VERLYRPTPGRDWIVGKYVQLGDAYLSVVEALRHAAIWMETLPALDQRRP